MSSYIIQLVFNDILSLVLTHELSKGTKRKGFIILALCCQPKYLLLDEAFDGLDPKTRIKFKRLLIERSGQMTVVISSHSLREIEKICDSYCLLDQSTCISGDLQNDLQMFYKFQLAYDREIEPDLFKGIDIISYNALGKIITIVVKGDEQEILNKLNQTNPTIMYQLEFSFEDYFIIAEEKKDA